MNKHLKAFVYIVTAIIVALFLVGWAFLSVWFVLEYLEYSFGIFSFAFSLVLAVTPIAVFGYLDFLRRFRNDG